MVYGGGGGGGVSLEGGEVYNSVCLHSNPSMHYCWLLLLVVFVPSLLHFLQINILGFWFEEGGAAGMLNLNTYTHPAIKK
jgi:hypothetical protein